jgi:hypothetical protein
MSAPPRTKIDIRQKPVSGRKSCFCLYWACCAAGLLKPDTPKELLSMCQAPAGQRWGHNVRGFLDDLAAFAASRLKTPPPSCFLIGLGSKGVTLMLEEDSGICPDPVLTVHILSRLAGTLYIPTRTPNLEWDTLFGESFLVDDPCLRFPSRYQDPWSKLIGAPQ